MFLQVCVCPQGGRVSASVHAGMPDPPPQTRQTLPPGPARTPPGADPPDQADPPQDQADTPPESRLQHTVYEQLVRILLECILVIKNIGNTTDAKHGFLEEIPLITLVVKISQLHTLIFVNKERVHECLQESPQKYVSIKEII